VTISAHPSWSQRCAVTSRSAPKSLVSNRVPSALISRIPCPGILHLPASWSKTPS